MAPGGGLMTPALGNGLPGPDRVVIWFNDPGNWWGPGGLLAHAREHLVYTLVVVVLAAVVAVPAGVLIGHTGRGVAFVAGTANALRAVPTLGLLILLIVLVSPRIHIGAGLAGVVAPGAVPYFLPVLAVLTLLAVPPILSGAYAGIRSVDPAVRDAAKGSGMTPLQVVLGVELPCALPLLFSGVRSAVLQVIATVTVAAYAPLVGGLGRLIVDGQQNLADPRYGYPAMVAAGIAVAVLAVTADALLGRARRLLVSPGLVPAPDPAVRRRTAPASYRPRIHHVSRNGAAGAPAPKDPA
ncbi:ABC transporter permease subunit [Streptomyces sp. NPDC026673]|uniref:ABC transporter permease n=1 Tax=Streptomyces sp. NPDC026673 TaxID=3155724 RepID=UPI00340C561C